MGTLRAVLLLVAALAAASTAQTRQPSDAHAPAAVLWQDPVDISTRDLFYGSGGESRQPRGRFTFISEDLSETKPKIVVIDAQGVRWKVKLGSEAQPEVAATRLVWAAGYFVDDAYYVARATIAQLPRLRRGQHYVGKHGSIRDARFERLTDDTAKTWDWFDNPFVDTSELNGLRVLMALVTNWDAANDNNAVRSGPDGSRIYYVSDLGSTFGAAEDGISGSRGDADDYADAPFIVGTTRTDVDFFMRWCGGGMAVFRPPRYQRCQQIRDVADDIPRADARWLGNLLGRLTANQIADAFRGAGYPPEDVGLFAETVSRRIAALRAL